MRSASNAAASVMVVGVSEVDRVAVALAQVVQDRVREGAGLDLVEGQPAERGELEAHGVRDQRSNVGC
ncbi:hypothetical protein [Nonomuraea sp. NPDC049158]|uniref:hypothetical protein n=1 Tax=Nonomuraea sp. NPDC049158 TaxID=3155649 RepID=UPI0033F22120